MTKIFSKIKTNVAYECKASGRVELKPGDNNVSQPQVDALNAPVDSAKPGDIHFQNAVTKGFLVIVADQPAAPTGPRAQLKGESDKKYAAYLDKYALENGGKSGDELTADQTKFVGDFLALDQADQDATYETLDASEKKLVDDAKAKIAAAA